jgi:hypothetical protein
MQALEFLKLISERLQRIIEQDPTALSFPVQLNADEIKKCTSFLKHFEKKSVVVTFKGDDNRGNYVENIIYFEGNWHNWEFLKDKQDAVAYELWSVFERAKSNATTAALKALWPTIIPIKTLWSPAKNDVSETQDLTIKFPQSDKSKLILIADFLNKEGQGIFEVEINFANSNAQHYGDESITISIKKVGEPTKSLQNEKIVELLAAFKNGANWTNEKTVEEATEDLSNEPPSVEDDLPAIASSSALPFSSPEPPTQAKTLERLQTEESSPKVIRELAALDGTTDINSSIRQLQALLRKYEDENGQAESESKKKEAKCKEMMIIAIKDQIATAESLRNYITKTRAYPGVAAKDIESLEKLTWDSVTEIDVTDKDLQSKIERIVKRHKDANDIVKRLEEHDPNRNLKNFYKCVAVFMCGVIGLLVLTALACGIIYACPPVAAAVFGIIAVAGITKASLLASAAGFLLGFLPGAGIGTSIFFFSKSAPSRVLDATQKVLVKQEQLPKPTRTEPESGIYDQPKKRK